MEHAREFGDPEVLLLAEDHIILKLETAWSRDMPVPDGLSFADDDGLLLVATRRSLVSAWQRTLLREARVSKALFCACAPFDSSDLYARAASEVLRDAVDICIVHNRDKIYKIIRMFPNVRTIALLHDLTTHVLELDEPCRDRFAPLVERCQLRQLVGNDGSRCNGSLHLSRETTLALIRTCPDVVVTSLDVLTKLSTFRNLRSLMVALSCGVAYADVDFELERLLKRLPGLEELDVGLCSGLRLSTIGRLCPKLKVLRIVTCVGSSEDTPVDGDAFPNLECVNISMHVLRMAFNSFLAATRFTLRTAFFDDDSMCFEFLQYCVRFGRRLPFPRLEHLTLDTKLSLRKLEIEPSWLGDLLKALPALRHLATNSYDLRLFFENNGVPRGRVSLSWIGCVYCAVHKPDNDRCS
ncbi:hypothetical protein HPB49_020917 [Dermacentor silvarum]|uniref:Uncharacterized protein n=1 Tax=Dermacentor silvarum TaxID=543639 RepID=A0ACB8C5E4_DERSI|nr:hypothetical protein HPB49_020917 [Dermacentor silvarum]